MQMCYSEARSAASICVPGVGLRATALLCSEGMAEAVAEPISCHRWGLGWSAAPRDELQPRRAACCQCYLRALCSGVGSPHSRGKAALGVRVGSQQMGPTRGTESRPRQPPRHTTLSAAQGSSDRSSEHESAVQMPKTEGTEQQFPVPSLVGRSPPRPPGAAAHPPGRTTPHSTAAAAGRRCAAARSSLAAGPLRVGCRGGAG